MPRDAVSRLSLIGLIASDLDRFRVTDKWPSLAIPIVCPAFVACVCYRLGKWFWDKREIPVLTPLLKAIYIVVQRLVDIYCGVWISPQAVIGPGLYIGHSGGVIVNRVRMGANCSLSQGVTLGESARGERMGLPTLGDRVYIAPGAKLFGLIDIGHDVAVGANAVVTRSIPDRGVAVGIPARVLSLKGSFEYVLYRSMDSDQSRAASLALRSATATLLGSMSPAAVPLTAGAVRPEEP
jgi:serine O-acetyltransferase